MLADTSEKKLLHPDEYYSVKEITRALGISRYTVYDLRDNSGLKVYTLGGKGKLFIKGSDILALMVPTTGANEFRF